MINHQFKKRFTTETIMILKTPQTLIALMLMPFLLLGCQTTLKAPPNTVTPINPNQIAPTLPNTDLPQRFNINGKIGVKSPNQTGSAFYTWSQAQNDFAINLEGILGVGRTNIRYDGNLATIISEKIPTENHTLTARSPEELLQKVSGWQAPISQLPYWILGKYAPSDSNNQLDAQGHLSVAHNGDWTAEFSYDNSNTAANLQRLPRKIIMKNTANTQVTLVINHL